MRAENHSTYYQAFGSPLNARTFSSPSYKYGFNGQLKDNEISGSGNTYTAMFWEMDPRIGRRWNIDPKQIPPISNYAIYNNSPIYYLDILGDTSEFYNISTGALLGTINDEGALRRIKIDPTVYNSVTTRANEKFAEGVMESNTQQERANFTTNTIIDAGQALEALDVAAGVQNPNYIAFETGVKSIEVSGSMRQGSTLIGDVDINILSHFDNNSTLVIGSFGGVAGGFGNGAPPNGNYTISNYQDRSLTGWYNAGMNSNGVGFSFNLNPQFTTTRTDLRVHPDGNSEGTLGCVGLSGTALQLTNFRDIVRTYTQTHQTINTNINIVGNPNNGAINAIPNVQE